MLDEEKREYEQGGSVLAWVDAHREEAIADLQRFCRQPSVAAQQWGMEEMRSLVVEALRSVGAETIQVPTTGAPVVVGRLDGESARRLAMYNHYDVQPPEPLEAWTDAPI